MNILKLFNDRKIQKKFTNIFRNNSFGGSVSLSGTGSDLIQTRIIIDKIPELINKYNIKSLIDAPCGDFFWMQHVNLDNVKYTGIDIVKELIRRNTQKYSRSNRKFISKNIITDRLPDGDIILIRDCWVHLSINDVQASVNNLKRSKIKYLLTTSFTDMYSNYELTGIWRPINLELPPFNFPCPLFVLNEECTEDNGRYKDKSLVLWEISSLPAFKV